MASDVDTGTVHGPIYGTSAIAQCDGHVLELARAQYDLALRDAASHELNDIVELLRRKNLVTGLGHLTQQQLQVGVDQSRARLKISQQRVQTKFDQSRVRNIRILLLGENEMKRGICNLLTFCFCLGADFCDSPPPPLLPQGRHPLRRWFKGQCCLLCSRGRSGASQVPFDTQNHRPEPQTPNSKPSTLNSKPWTVEP